MLEVQYNEEAERALEIELRKVSSELSDENLCCQLEEYLQQKKWRDADEETARIFYLVMILKKYENLVELCEKFPSQILNEIDQLWVKYSKGHFGFSVQKRIWESVGGKPDSDYDTCENFARGVGWLEKNGLWRNYDTLLRECRKYSLPALSLFRSVSITSSLRSLYQSNTDPLQRLEHHWHQLNKFYYHQKRPSYALSSLMSRLNL
jgi:hypothetical protein